MYNFADDAHVSIILTFILNRVWKSSQMIKMTSLRDIYFLNAERSHNKCHPKRIGVYVMIGRLVNPGVWKLRPFFIGQTTEISGMTYKGSIYYFCTHPLLLLGWYLALGNNV